MKNDTQGQLLEQIYRKRSIRIAQSGVAHATPTKRHIVHLLVGRELVALCPWLPLRIWGSMHAAPTLLPMAPTMLAEPRRHHSEHVHS